MLRKALPAGNWWPAQSDFEIVVGAILTQNTAWTNVERSIEQLRKAGLLDASTLSCHDPADIEALIRPSGFQRAKSRYLINAATWFLSSHDDAASLEDDDLRHSLLKVRGIGPETADDIMLYVYCRPVFIWDAYTRRLLTAAGYRVPSHYEAARQELGVHVERAQMNAHELAEFHGLIVDAGKRSRRVGNWQWLLG
ncbi:MAG: deoxyribonuclease [Actinomycetaceae bacterium]|nr:deoxyribonuclease [Actinomycetaceae bacterium]